MIILVSFWPQVYGLSSKRFRECYLFFGVSHPEPNEWSSQADLMLDIYYNVVSLFFLIEKFSLLGQVVPASVPDPVRDCRCEQHNDSSGQVLVRCEPGQNGSIEQTFAIQVGTSY